MVLDFILGFLKRFCSGVVEEYVACDPLHVSVRNTHTYTHINILTSPLSVNLTPAQVAKQKC